jgi:hypothetical protein
MTFSCMDQIAQSLYDSEGNPKLRVPEIKVVRALALLGFLMRGSRTILYRLALAVMVGTLQYLVQATPNVIGASFLHHVCRNIHNDTLESFDNIHFFYHSRLALGALAQTDLTSIIHPSFVHHLFNIDSSFIFYPSFVHTIHPLIINHQSLIHITFIHVSSTIHPSYNIFTYFYVASNLTNFLQYTPSDVNMI